MTRPVLHDRLFIIALLAGFPSLVAALYLLGQVIDDPVWFWPTALAVAAPWLGGALLLRSHVVYQLRTAANLVTALRQGELGFRARQGRRDGGD